MRDGWKRVTVAHPCPVCGRPKPEHKATWCIYTTDGTAAICPFTAGGAYKNLGAAGYLHRRTDHILLSSAQLREKPLPERKPIVNWPALTALYCRAVKDDRLCALAFKLGVLPEALSRLHVGLCAQDVWTFPMSDGEKVIGIRTRTTDGEKKAVYGSRSGLFIPANLRGVDLLLVCEGPTDTAAMLSIGFDAIGRADCNHVKYTDRVCKGRDIVIVADPDEVGRRGASQVQKYLYPHCVRVRVTIPPAKDARAWVKAGVLHADVMKAITG